MLFILFFSLFICFHKPHSHFVYRLPQSRLRRHMTPMLMAVLSARHASEASISTTRVSDNEVLRGHCLYLTTSSQPKHDHQSSDISVGTCLFLWKSYTATLATCNPNVRQYKEGGWWVQDQHGLHSKTLSQISQ